MALFFRISSSKYALACKDEEKRGGSSSCDCSNGMKWNEIRALHTLMRNGFAKTKPCLTSSHEREEMDKAKTAWMCASIPLN